MQIKLKDSSTVFSVAHEGVDYYIALLPEREDSFCNCYLLRKSICEEYIPEPEVGDLVQIRGVYTEQWSPDIYKLLYIHQEGDDYRKYGVMAYHGHAPFSARFENIRVAEGDAT